MAVRQDQRSGDDHAVERVSRDRWNAVVDCFLGVGAFLLVTCAIVYAVLGTQVESSTPIGKVVNVTGGGGWAVKLVVQTDTGFYPLKGSVAIERGTPLHLERRRNGDTFVCAEDHGCVETAQGAWTRSGSLEMLVNVQGEPAKPQTTDPAPPGHSLK